MKTIELTQGKVALVDDEDFDRVSQFKWCASKHPQKNSIIWYAVRTVRISRTAKTVRMHRFILPGYAEIDHCDCNGLNNQKFNLRPATSSNNKANRRKSVHCSSKFKGVNWRKAQQKWCARIKLDKKEKWLGYFDDEIEAARAYDREAKKQFGEFARLNFSK